MAGEIANPQATADIQLLGDVANVLAELGQKLDSDLNRLPVRFQVQKLRADVEVDAAHVQVRGQSRAR